jgi:hypothetical protein
MLPSECYDILSGLDNSYCETVMNDGVPPAPDVIHKNDAGFRFQETTIAVCAASINEPVATVSG